MQCYHVAEIFRGVLKYVKRRCEIRTFFWCLFLIIQVAYPQIGIGLIVTRLQETTCRCLAMSVLLLNLRKIGKVLFTKILIMFQNTLKIHSISKMVLLLFTQLFLMISPCFLYLYVFLFKNHNPAVIIITAYMLYSYIHQSWTAVFLTSAYINSIFIKTFKTNSFSRLSWMSYGCNNGNHCSWFIRRHIHPCGICIVASISQSVQISECYNIAYIFIHINLFLYKSFGQCGKAKYKW